MDGIEVEQLDGEHGALPRLLASLDDLHRLREGAFATPARLTGAGESSSVRLLAVVDGAAEGFLSGNPITGHLALVGVLRPRRGVGSVLVGGFIDRARAAGASAVTVVLDTDPHGRWCRRQFFESLCFSAGPGSALHFRLVL